MHERDGSIQGDEKVREILRAHGLRYTHPRACIVAHFAQGDVHVSAEELHRVLTERGERISLSTVYLNLGVLGDAGVIRSFEGVAGEKIYDGNPSPHYHLVCTQTGRVVDVVAPTVDGMPLGQFLRRTLEAATGWTIEEPKLQLRGVSPLVDDDDD